MRDNQRWSQRMRTAFHTTAVLVATCSASTTLAQTASPSTASQLDAVQARGVLQVCTTGDYKPFTFHRTDSDT